MLSFDGIVELINNNKYERDFRLIEANNVYYGMSLHIDGVRPAYRCLNESGAWINIKPHQWVCNEYDFIFNYILFSRHPREHEDTRQWRLSQYRPFTRAPFLQCISVITGAIFQDSSYSITIENKEDNDYIWGNNFEDKDLVQYISDNFQHIAEDPNGMFVVIPKEPYYDTTTQKIEPTIWFIKSKFIKHRTEDEVIFEHGEYMWCVNRLGYFRFQREDGKKRGKYIHVDEVQGGYYAHMSGKLPAFIAGGIWNSQGFYDSWFVNAKPLADEYVSTYSSLQMVNKEASHPFIVEASEDCVECNKTGTVQFCTSCNNYADRCACEPVDGMPGGVWALKSCTTCGGKGTISHNPGDRLIAPADMMNHPLVQIINPEVSVNEFHSKFTQDLFNNIFRSLYLNYIEQAQSGVAKDKDMEARYQFILRISNDLFDRLLYNIIGQILSLRNVRTQNGVSKPYEGDFVIIKPTQFQIKTSNDLLEEYNKAREAQVPDYQKTALLEDFIEKQYSGDEILKRKTYIINRVDILAVMDPADIQIALLNNAATPRDYQFHIHLPIILDKLVRRKGNEWFVNADLEVIETEARAEFNTLKPPPMQLQPEQIDETRVDADI